MGKFTSIGTKLFVADGIPATQDKAGYEAMTWVEIGELTDLPTYGPETQVVVSSPLATGVDEKFPGTTNFGSVDFGMDLDADDAGQASIEAALPIGGIKIPKSYHVKYTKFDEYFFGSFFSNMRSASGNSMVTSSSKVEIDSPITRVLPV